MKKAVSMFLAAALAVGTFAGCGSSADTGSTGSAASTESGSTDSAADGSVFKIGVLCLLRTIFLETTYASCSGSTPASISNFVFLRIFGAFKASPSLSPTLPMKR